MTERTASENAASGLTARRSLVVAAVALICCLWAFSTLYFGGQSGKWLDDYSLSVRDPVTGAYSLPVWYWKLFPPPARPFLYRPLHLTWMFNVHTVLWEQDRLLHLVNALCHLGVVLLLWRLLSHLTRVGWIAFAGALLFLVFPLNYEIVFWPSALSGGLATVTLLLLFDVYHRFIRGGIRRYGLLLMATLAFLIPCWNEQPASGVAALPLLYLAMGGRRELRGRRIIAVVMPWLLCCLACLIYVRLVQATAPESVRGSKGSMIHPMAASERVVQVATELRQKLFGAWMAAITEGGVRFGWQHLTRAAVIPWAILLAAACGWWLWKACITYKAAPSESQPPVSARPLWAVVFGLASFALSWVPIVAVRGQNVEARMCYYPVLTLVIAVAGLADFLVAPIRLPRWMAVIGRTTAATVVLAACLVCGLSLVGLQAVYRSRYAMDRDEMAQLHRLVPAPAADSVFLPLLLQDRPARTGVGIFDHFAVPALGASFSGEAIIRETYRRKDLLCIPFGWWTGQAPLSGFDATGFRYDLSGQRMEWSRVVPFVIDREGSVSLIDRVSVAFPDGHSLVVPLPHMRSVTERLGLAERQYAISAGR